MKSNYFLSCCLSVVLCILIYTPSYCSAETSELIGLLTSQLGVTEKQAEGGAGSLFKIAKNSLSGENFSKVAESVPGMDLLLKAAPELPKVKGMGNIASSLGGGSGGGLDMAGLPAMFGKLGMDSGMIVKFIPTILSFVQSKGGDSVMNMLKGVWQK
ncbi:MAG: DUF2780 domain-containing protein [Proteobacteria bacterium]|nr:DUF2780 domain-containing protein [Pseudomonadota bacterium]